MKFIQFLLSGTILFTACIPQRPTDRIEFEAAEAYPEGIAFDSVRNVYYVSSARTGKIGKVSSNGTYTVMHGDTSLKSTYGMKVHPDGKRLFVCAADANYSKYTSPDTRKKMSRLIILDLESGRKLSDIDLSGLVPGQHFVNDITFDNQGNAYITDSFAHVIYKVSSDGKASVFSKDKQFETAGIGLNGIVYHPSGFLLADNTNTGQIYKIDIRNPQNVQKVSLDQFYLGADGLVLKEANKLVVVVNGGSDKIFQLETEDNWSSAKMGASTLLSDRFTYPATATLRGQDVWVMNARFSELADSNAVPSNKFHIQHAVLKPLPKPKK